MADNHYYNPESFLGFLNLLKVQGNSNKFPGAPRPTFPPMIVEPTIPQVYDNLNFADFGMFTTAMVYGLAGTAYVTLRSNRIEPTRCLKDIYRWRLLHFRINLVYCVALSGIMAMINCYSRVGGLVYNGNKWRSLKHEKRMSSLVQDHGVIGMIKRLQN